MPLDAPKRVKLTSAHMEAFMVAYLMNDLASPVGTPAFHFDLWDMFTDAHPLVAAAAPRSHAKSTAGTFAYSLASALFRVDKYIIIVSRTYTISVEFVRSIKMTLENNEKLRRDFGIEKFEIDAEDDVIVTCRDGYQFRIKALAFLGSVRGINWGTQRPTLVIVDDAEDDEQVLSQERREKAMNWMLAALLPVVDQQVGRVRVVGTFLHNDAMLVNLCSSDSWMSRVWEAHNDDFSQILWPEMFTADKLKSIRQRYIDAGKLELYNMEYRNKVVDTSSGFFRKDEFVPMEEHEKTDAFKKSLTWYASGDFAISTKERRDYTVFFHVGFDYTFTMYVYFVLRERMDGPRILDEMYALQNGLFPPELWFLEKGAISMALEAGIDARQRQSGTFLNIQPMPAIKDKITRARPLQARMRAKKVKWDTSADWFPEIQTEFLEFPRGKHDDAVDSLAHMAIGLADQVVTPQTPDEIDEEEYWRRKEQTSSSFNGGRNKTTGY